RQPRRATGRSCYAPSLKTSRSRSIATRRAHLALRWKDGALNDALALPRSRPATIRTDEDTIALLRRLSAHYPDTVIAGILNRVGRPPVSGHRFPAGRAGTLRRHWGIPCSEPMSDVAEGELMTIKRAPEPTHEGRHYAAVRRQRRYSGAVGRLCSARVRATPISRSAGVSVAPVSRSTTVSLRAFSSRRRAVFFSDRVASSFLARARRRPSTS